MHKYILKFFDFLRSSVHFIKIILLFLTLIYILFWTNNLANFNWSWIKLIAPILEQLSELGNLLMNGSITLFNAVFEYKYLGALLIIIASYYLCNVLTLLITKIEYLYDDSRIYIKKKQEEKFNKQLVNDQINEQKLIKKYVVYISTKIKKRFNNKNFNINIEEQNKILHKFLMEKTGITPEKFQQGYIYKFNDFETIDKTLDILNKVLQTKTPLDYIISVHVYQKSFSDQFDTLLKLISLELINKISMFSETAYRYKFNQNQKYKTIQQGLFQRENEAVEAYCFEEI